MKNEQHSEWLWEQFGIGLQGLITKHWERDMEEKLQAALRAEENAWAKVAELEELLDAIQKQIAKDGALRIGDPLYKQAIAKSENARK